jgi:hypothetical protein
MFTVGVGLILPSADLGKNRLSDDQRHKMAMAILFLHSDMDEAKKHPKLLKG